MLVSRCLWDALKCKIIFCFQVYKTELEKDIISDTSGDFRKLMVALAKVDLFISLQFSECLPIGSSLLIASKIIGFLTHLKIFLYFHFTKNKIKTEGQCILTVTLFTASSHGDETGSCSK